jgi:transcriptional regulator with XRE-family HTH domain
MSEYEPNTSREAIANRLIALRKAKGWSSTFIATAVGATPQRWYTYENGRSVPPAPVLAKVRQLTGATADFILFGDTRNMPYELMQQLEHIGEVEKTQRKA